MVNRIHSRHIGQQRLCGTDVGCRLFALDMLFAGLKRHTQRPGTTGIHRYTNNSSRNAAFEFIACTEESRMRTSKTHWHTKTLCRANCNIGTQFTRRCKQGKRQQVCGHNHQTIDSMHRLYELTVILNRTIAVWILYQRAKIGFIRRGCMVIINDHFNAQGFSAGYHHINGLRKAMAVYKETGAADHIGTIDMVEHHRHCFCSGSGFIQQGGIYEWQGGQFGHHGLKVEQALQAALRYFSLIRGVLRVPSRIFKYIPQDNRGGYGSIIALANAGFENLIPGSHLPQTRQVFKLMLCRR